MAKFLHIESATKICSVALSEDGKLIDVVEQHSENYIHGEKLTVFIQQIMEKNCLNFNELNAIVVTSGPGSYTGLRIGVSVAKGLCYAQQLPLIAVNAIESIAALAREKYPAQTICAMIDARRMEVFSAIYDSSKQIVKPLSADVLEKDSYTTFYPFVACGDGASKIKPLWEDNDVIIDEEISSSATGQIKIAWEKYKQKKFEDIAYFEPMYLKDFVVTPPKKKV